MFYKVSKEDIKDNFSFVYGNDEYKGVVRVCDYIRNDFLNVFDCLADFNIDNSKKENQIVFGTIGKSKLIDEIINQQSLDVSDLVGKRECYKYICSKDDKQILYIVGSDKRGTIYGLFHLSDILGVSPFTNWCDVIPDKKDELLLEDKDFVCSKEPSVKYRGFFINDEWPAFGTWVNHHFGGFNTLAYEKIFEILLRMKGNYLWPAMWSARFSEDGPGLANAYLADEMGVIMGMSHHEPCLRHGEEYKYLRGKDSIYGDAWSFISNKEGITRFWEDGLKRNGKFENVITVGMRGEFDSTILGDDATLKDNIDLLRDVLQTQNRLIKENVCKDLTKVPRMLALYKEVEPFFYGDKDTKGLMGSEELDGVTLMLCDDNHGNLRTLPDENMKGHNGGYGMYYHFDYHGGPVSFEWVNSSSLYKTWEQMTTAYEAGIRQLWIVNVGDVFTNEYPLSFFLDMAYDYEKWGISNINSAKEYTKYFVDNLFGTKIAKEFRENVVKLLEGYTKIAHSRRPEALNDKVYAPICFGEREKLYNQCKEYMQMTKDMYESCNEDKKCSFYEFVYYPVMANLNLVCMWLDTTYNHYLASIGASYAMKVGKKVSERIKFDKELVNELHSIYDGKWLGMGLSEHIGFKFWNEEECQYPVVHSFEPSNKARIVAVIPETGCHCEGSVWSKKELILPDFLRYNRDYAYIDLYSTSDKDAGFKVTGSTKGLEVTPSEGIVKKGDKVRLTVTKNNDLNVECGNIHIHGEFMEQDIVVPFAKNMDTSNMKKNTFIFNDNYVSIEAGHYTDKIKGEGGEFVELVGFGKTVSGIKAFPVDKTYSIDKDAPKISYDFYTQNEGEYTVTLYVGPSNPPYKDYKLLYGWSCNDSKVSKENIIPDDFGIYDGNSSWEYGPLNNIRLSSFTIKCNKGINTLSILPISPGFVLEKIVIEKKGTKVDYSFFGPTQTMHV